MNKLKFWYSKNSKYNMRKQLPQNIISSVVTNVEKNDVVMGKMALTLFGEMGVWEEFK